MVECSVEEVRKWVVQRYELELKRRSVAASFAPRGRPSRTKLAVTVAK